MLVQQVVSTIVVVADYTIICVCYVTGGYPGDYSLCCMLQFALSGCYVALVGMAKALQAVALKRGNEDLLKSRAGIKVAGILH